MNRYTDAAAALLGKVSADVLETMASRIEEGRTAESVISGLGANSQVLQPALSALVHDDVDPQIAAAYLRGAVRGYLQREAEQTVEVVWSGPRSHAVPTRATAQVLKELIDRADKELILVTYSAREYEPIVTALLLAVARGVAVTIVVETLQGAAGAIKGQEPAAAFAKVSDVQLWHWPSHPAREHAGAKMHAKIAVADRRELFTSSVNLTASGVERSIECGVLVRGGAAPARAAEHVRALQAANVLQRLTATSA